MFLLRTKTRQHETVQLYDVFEEAVDAAREHVGDHNPDDSCSSIPTSFARPDSYRSFRSTSFGLRQAAVDPVSTLKRTDLMPW